MMVLQRTDRKGVVPDSLELGKRGDGICMKITTRQAKILRSLCNESNISSKQLASDIGVTSGTLRTEIQNLNEILREYDMELRIDSKNQIKVLGDEQLTRLMKETNMLEEFPLENQIILLLILSSGYLTLQEVADALYVSKSLVEKQMPLILRKYGEEIQSTRHYGIRFGARELKRRTMFVELLKPYVVGANFELEIEQFHRLHFPLMDFLSADQLKTAWDMMHGLMEQQDILFADDAVCHMFLYLLISLHGIGQQRYLKEEEIPAGMAKMAEGEEKYLQLAEDIRKRFSEKTAPQEERYLAYLLMSLRKYKLSDKEEIVAEMSPVVRKIFDRIRDSLCWDFSGDEFLSEGLALHIYTAILRDGPCEAGGVTCSSREFRRQYPLGIEMATAAAEIITDEFQCRLSECDVLYLGFHFQAAVERIRTNDGRVRAAIVCQYNAAAANLIAERIKRRFSGINIVGIYSLQEFKAREDVTSSCVDLLLTTEKIPDRKIKTIYITPMLKEAEMQMIENFVEKKKLSDTLLVRIGEAEVYHPKRCLDKEQIIRESLGILEDKGFITCQYVESVLQREHVSSTNLKYIAVPHGSPNEVIQTKLLIARLDEPVKWGDANVRCVFLFAYDNQMLADNPMFMGNFYRNLAKIKVEEQIEQLKDLEDEAFKTALVEILM